MEGMRSFKRIDKHSMSMTDDEKGSRTSDVTLYLIPGRISQGRGLTNYIRGQARGTTSGTGMYRRVRFRSCGTVVRVDQESEGR